ncbi:hypothetical protein TWF696_000390 [Orbilia brochopaga]|uniref:FAS1 domain-containing protein n=1 Tax=Orbilia brochopaga TaxID=3140254 RepID=A0AAV9VE75_9PEZI
MKASLLLPVASAVLTAALLVIPDGQTTNQIVLDDSHHQAPIASNDKAHLGDAKKPPVEGGDATSPAPGWQHRHLDDLQPEYVLRWDYRLENRFGGEQASIDDFYGLQYILQRTHRFTQVDPTFFSNYYHHPGAHQRCREGRPFRSVGHYNYRHGDEPHWPPKPPGDRPWPPTPPQVPTNLPTNLPTSLPTNLPTSLPTSLPDDPPHWPPKPPSWPPKPPGEPGDTPHWPPKPPGHPGDGPPHHPPPPPHHPPPHHGPPHRPPPHHFPHIHNETIWQLISKANVTSAFAKVVSEFDDLVNILNSTAANHTVFVPTNSAFERLKKHLGDHKISKELKKKALLYHILNQPLPIFKLLFTHTAATSLVGEELGGNQRLRFGLGHHGFAVNFYSHIRAANIFASNGVIHGVDSILIPPLPIPVILRLFPAQFSTFYYAVHLSNLTHEVSLQHTGATLFAPPNSAWERLPPKITAFLFSPWGRRYLKALVKYHIVLNDTLYSDAYYHSSSEEQAQGSPRRHFHVDLPTLLEGKHLSIDVGRLGPLINIVINGHAGVKVQDVVARDGVIQVVGNLLIPPRTRPPGAQDDYFDTADMEFHAGLRKMTLEDFKSRFEGLLEEGDDKVQGEYMEEDGGALSLWDF